MTVSKRSFSGKYTIKLYDHLYDYLRKESNHENVRSLISIFDPRKFEFFIQKTETIRSLGRKVYDLKSIS